MAETGSRDHHTHLLLVRTAPAPAFVPRYCTLDKKVDLCIIIYVSIYHLSIYDLSNFVSIYLYKVLRFFGHFHEVIPDGMGTETRRVRSVQLLYYLEDDTLCLVEPRLHNSGLDQGILVKRHRVPKNSCFQVDTGHCEDRRCRRCIVTAAGS